MRVLVTRPARDAALTAERLAAAGHVGIIAPVTRIAARGGDIPEGPFSAVLATSVHAVECLGEATISRLRGTPLFSVGARAGELARARGFEDVRPPAADAQAMLAAMSMPPNGALLYLAGRDRKPVVERELSARGWRIDVVEIYEAAAEASLPQAAIDALTKGGVDAVLNFSRRGAEILIELAREARVLELLLALPHICISADVAAPFKALRARTKVAASPNWEGMAAALRG